MKTYTLSLSTEMLNVVLAAFAKAPLPLEVTFDTFVEIRKQIDAQNAPPAPASGEP